MDTTLSEMADGVSFSNINCGKRFADFNEDSSACSCTIEKMQMALFLSR